MKKLMISLLLCVTSYAAAVSQVTTLLNDTGVNLHVVLYFSDNSIQQEDMSMAQSHQIVNFDTKFLKSATISSPDKDKNGNLFGQLEQKFTAPKGNENYTISLKKVPAHHVAATQDMPAYMMPATQTIVCMKHR